MVEGKGLKAHLGSLLIFNTILQQQAAIIQASNTQSVFIYSAWPKYGSALKKKMIGLKNLQCFHQVLVLSISQGLSKV